MFAHLGTTTGWSALAPHGQLMVILGVVLVSAIISFIMDMLLGDAGIGVLAGIVVLVLITVISLLLLNQFYQQLRLTSRMIVLAVPAVSGFFGLLGIVVVKNVMAR